MCTPHAHLEYTELIRDAKKVNKPKQVDFVHEDMKAIGKYIKCCVQRSSGIRQRKNNDKEINVNIDKINLIVSHICRHLDINITSWSSQL